MLHSAAADRSSGESGTGYIVEQLIGAQVDQVQAIRSGAADRSTGRPGTGYKNAIRYLTSTVYSRVPTNHSEPHPVYYNCVFY